MSQTIDHPAVAVTTRLKAPKLEHTRGQRKTRSLRKVLLPLLVFVAALGVWTAVTYLVLDDRRRFLLPPPWAVISDGLLGDNLTLIVPAFSQTASVALTGLMFAIIIGVTVAVVMSQSRRIEESVFPYAIIIQTLPILAIVPLVGLWLGFNFQSRVIVCVLMSLFPVITNTLFGLKSADRGLHDLATLHSASRWTRLRTISFPAALPSIFVGMRIAGGMSVIGAIVGDFFFRQGTPGIGRLLDVFRANLDFASLMAAILVCSMLGLVVFWTFGFLSKVCTGRWSESGAER